METFDVIVLGGGIIGTSIARMMVEKKKLRVALIEQNTVGNSGATKVSGGFIRAFDLNSSHALLTLSSMSTHKKWAAVMDFVQEGHLYILPKSKLHEAAKTLKLFDDYQYAYQILDARQAKKIMKDLNFTRNELVIWEPLAGYASPRKMAGFLKDLFLKAGGKLFEQTKVGFLKQNEAQETLVTTNKGSFLAKKVVICLGAGNRKFMKDYGHDCHNKLIELVKVPYDSKSKICFNDLKSGLYSKPAELNTRWVGLPQATFDINPYETRNLNASFFEKNSNVFKERMNLDQTVFADSVSSADSYTREILPQIKIINDHWTLVNGLNGAGFKMYPAISQFIFQSKQFNDYGIEST